MSNHNTTTVSRNGVTSLVLLGITLVLLKAFGIISISWLWALAPFWVPFLLFVIILFFVLLFVVLAAIMS